MKILKFFFLTYCLLLVGCGSHMKYVADQTLLEVPGGKSRVVFFRSSFLGHAISASLYDVTNGEPEFIGIMNNDTKIAYVTDPGKHIFMVVSEAADFLKANIEPRKTYYAIVTPRFGVWKARFSLRPIRRDGTTEYNTTTEDFEEWMEDTKLVVNTAESRQWFQSNLPDIKAKQAEYWLKWQQKTEAEKAEVTLNATDGGSSEEL